MNHKSGNELSKKAKFRADLKSDKILLNIVCSESYIQII